MKIFEPKPPPTSGAITRSLCSGAMPLKADSTSRADMRILAGGVKREAALSAVILADGRARLHGIGNQPIVDEVDLGDVLGLRERRIHRRLVAQVPVVDSVVRRLGVHLRLAIGLRLREIDARRPARRNRRPPVPLHRAPPPRSRR